MPRKAQWPPPIYSNSGSDYMRVWLAPGQKRDIRLGPTGSDEARATYARMLAEMNARGGRLPPPRGEDVALAHVLHEYLVHAEATYEHRQFERIKTALRPVARLYGTEPAASFGTLALEAVRTTYVDAGYCRRYCNQLTTCVRQMFRWAAAKELVESSTADRLMLLDGLRRQRGLKAKAPASGGDERQAPDHEPVRAVHLGLVEATLPYLPPVVADLVRVLCTVGARPGEICALRGCDIDRDWTTADGVRMWLYRLDQHKTDWRGHLRWIPLPPAAQQILAPYLLRRPADSYVFSPRETFAWWAVRYGKRMNAARARAPGEQYTTQAVDRCIRLACDRHLLPRWAPNQIRHAVLTRIELELGREDARCVGGHKSASTTAIYAESVERAARAMIKIAAQ